MRATTAAVLAALLGATATAAPSTAAEPGPATHAATTDATGARAGEARRAGASTTSASDDEAVRAARLREQLDRGPGAWDPQPAPGAVLSAGTHQVGARVSGPLAVGEDVVLLVDADTVAARLTVPPDADELVVTAAVALAAGVRDLTVRAPLADGGVVERTWSVTVAGPATTRLAGDDRVATSLAIASATHDGPTTTAVLARADDFADALAGAPLATYLEAPLLLTPGDGLAGAVGEHLAATLPAGAEVLLLGGPAALGPAVVTDLAALGLRARRVAGDDRYATAALVAVELPGWERAWLASGTAFPDALAASVPAARAGEPVLLTRPDTLPASTAVALRTGAPTEVVVAGGPAAVDDAVLVAVDAPGRSARRVAGEDRFATAAAIADEVVAPGTSGDGTVALADGLRFPDALAGAQHAAAAGAPLLLARTTSLPDATADALSDLRPATVVAYGGAAALADDVLAAAHRAAVRSPGAPRLVASTPSPGSTSHALDELVLAFDAPVVPAASRVHVTVGGVELAGDVAGDPDDPAVLRFTTRGPASPTTGDAGLDLRVVARAVSPGGAIAHVVVAATHRAVSGPFARVGPVTLHLPSVASEVVGFHQSLNDGALAQVPVDAAPVPWLTMPSRRRDTDRHGAADVAAAPGAPVVSPVTGVVKRAGSYTLYCDHRDHYLVVAPDAAPSWEVKVLHFEGLVVSRGDRVVAGETVVGAAPRLLPFSSQVDQFSGPDDHPHLHLEVVDPSIPDRPSPGGGC